MTRTKNDIRKMLATALEVTQQAKQQQDSDERPFSDHTLRQITQGKGILRSADQHPALPMTVKSAPLESQITPLDLGWAAVDPEAAEQAYLSQWTNLASHNIERGRRAGLNDGKQDKSARRMAVARARAERKKQFDALAASAVKPDPERLGQAWMVVLPMSGIVEKMAASKARWASRYLGTVVEDVPQQVIEAMVLILAKSDQDLAFLAKAARELGDESSRTGRIPGEQLSDDERKERRDLAKARKWLMGMANNRVMGALVDAYTSVNNLRWDNIDLIATVMASIAGKGEDPANARFKADRAPSMLGTRYQRPGGVDPELVSAIIAAAITDRRLDALVELLLDEDNRRTDGAFMWTKNAERVFLSTEGGADRWNLVVRATEHLADPRSARAEAARRYVRHLFEFLPAVMVAAVESFDQEVIRRTMRNGAGIVAHMESEFDYYVYLTGCSTERRPVRPTLDYATPTEAAEAILSVLGDALTGNEIAASIAYA